jgi:uncharacterized protein YeaO (DUF488 family)
MPRPTHPVAIKRVYDAPARSDGLRVLVDRLWPRGVRKDAAALDQWRKDLAPSAELRTFYGHRPERFAEFASRYRAELRQPAAAAAVDELVDLTERRRVTLLTATRDLPRSGAAVLAKHVQQIVDRRTRARIRRAAATEPL